MTRGSLLRRTLGAAVAAVAAPFVAEAAPTGVRLTSGMRAGFAGAVPLSVNLDGKVITRVVREQMIRDRFAEGEGIA